MESVIPFAIGDRAGIGWIEVGPTYRLCVAGQQRYPICETLRSPRLHGTKLQRRFIDGNGWYLELLVDPSVPGVSPRAKEEIIEDLFVSLAAATSLALRQVPGDE